MTHCWSGRLSGAVSRARRLLKYGTGPDTTRDDEVRATDLLTGCAVVL
ncbi:hypothetical protein I553_1766 [Mycobacterium xenopi 4042]|uniref:Uncharacterized protein n=1 Tax=Mycobacterium xenopi 4042 TaxID=1299334 RepID=X8DLI0_MYCXE|nr:hypothetical protein I552_7474 [Mycobacterium xenopi 3993]EUA68578.1 hypothetical protein I553_1766 [Mycobacterium xenopi 4042]